MRLIDADALMVYCNNQKVKTVDANDIARFPTINVMPVVRGRWIPDTAFGNDIMSNGMAVLCSVCGQGHFQGETKFCPNCGAKMDGAKEE